MLSVTYAECHYAECHYAECRGAGTYLYNLGQSFTSVIACASQ
jgi:hypothetical protein